MSRSDSSRLLTLLTVGLLTTGGIAAAQPPEENPARSTSGNRGTAEWGSERRAAEPARTSGKDLGTLDEIKIDGELDAPRVLFITARERQRYRDGHHRRYLPAGEDLLRTAPLPRWWFARVPPLG